MHKCVPKHGNSKIEIRQETDEEYKRGVNMKSKVGTKESIPTTSLKYLTAQI